MADLGLNYRLSIYDFFDALPNLKGRLARTRLSVVVAKRVLPVWDSIPEEHGYLTMPKLMVSTAEQLLSFMQKGMTTEALDQQAQRITVKVVYGTEAKPVEIYTDNAISLAQLASEMDSITGESPASLYYPAWCAFLTAMNALREALGWSWWNGDPTPLAALAYAGGAWSAFEEQDSGDLFPQGTWDYSSPEVQAKRREFWEWWCMAAVPETWKVVSLLDW